MVSGVKQRRVISPILLVYIHVDPLLDRLRMSSFGCHIKGVYIGALSYADDITIMCLSIGGGGGGGCLIKIMLKTCQQLCAKYLYYMCIIFNNKKTVRIKFGRVVR